MSGKVALVTDSVATVPTDVASELGVGIVALSVVVEGTTYQDGKDLDPADFYRLLRRPGAVARTAAPSPAAFAAAIEERAEAGAEEVICVTLSRALSATWEAAVVGTGLAIERHRDLRVEVVDSRTAAIAEGFIVMEAARAAMDGAPFDIVMERITAVRERVGLVVALSSLDYLVRIGRAGRASALAGSLLKVRPFISIGADGLVEPVGRARTDRLMLEALAKHVIDHPRGTRLARVAVMEADGGDLAARLLELLPTRLAADETLLVPFTPVMGAGAGPDLVGLGFQWEE